MLIWVWVLGSGFDFSWTVMVRDSARPACSRRRSGAKAGFPFRFVLVGPAPPVLHSPHTPSE
eukprot:6290585-Prymnesium_polylepis.1